MQHILPSHATQFIMKLQKALLLELRFNKEFRVGRPLRAPSHEHRNFDDIKTSDDATSFSELAS